MINRRNAAAAVSLWAIALPFPASATASASGGVDIGAMFLGAEPLVKAVMLLLIGASVLCWTIALLKGFEISSGTRALEASILRIRDAGGLGDLQSLDGRIGEMVRSACEELDKSRLLIQRGQVNGACARVGDRFTRVEARAFARMRRGLPVLASIGSVGPFVGLFGTVWGIMHSFANIAGAQSTGLAVVAPGISEALLATALGLGAAIPATVLYNYLLRLLAGYRLALENAASLMLGVAAREIETLAIVERIRISA